MKRFFIIASMAILAIGCQKTEIQNEVQNQIGFSTETGKLTRAIVQNDEYFTDQPFAVYSYSHQWIDANDDETKDEGEETTTSIMTNVEIKSTGTTTGEGTSAVTTYTWKSTTGSYYWPNDPRTSLNFYAYSPAYVTNGTATEDHQKLTFAESNGSGVSHSETAGLTLTNYIHSNMYVDFMVATPVKGSTYSDPDASGTANAQGEYGIVPMTFNHQMTQILFNVTTDKAYPGITFTVEEITLKNIINTATYTNSTLTSVGTYGNGTWSSESVTGITTDEIDTYTIFPADDEDAKELSNESTATTYASMLTTPVTMIPQKIFKATSRVEPGNDSYASEESGQMFMIKYSISGEGVADETVIKHVPFKATEDAVIDWAPNKKITYTVKIGLNEIYFEPSVAEWDDTDENGTEDTGDDEPWGDEFEFAQ